MEKEKTLNDVDEEVVTPQNDLEDGLEDYKDNEEEVDESLEADSEDDLEKDEEETDKYDDDEDYEEEVSDKEVDTQKLLDNLKKPKQDKDENAKFAEIRRKAEADADKKVKEAEEKALKIAKMAGFNSIQEFEAKQESKLEEARLEKLKNEAYAKGIDEDVYIQSQETYEFVKAQKAEKLAREQAEKEAIIRKQQADNDIAEFNVANPDVDVAKLLTSVKFAKFAKGKIGTDSLATVYEDYKDFISETEQATILKIASKKNRSTGGGNGASTQSTLNKGQQLLLDNWNKKNPDMKMTVEEFLKY
jgi:DnaJ family protein A protein 5